MSWNKYSKNKNYLTTSDGLEYFSTFNKPSIAEAKIMSNLNSLGISYTREVSFKDFKTSNGGYYRFDFFIPSKNIIIEYDGKEWHKDKESDTIKNEFCKTNNIKLIRLTSKHYYKLKETLKRRIK